MKKLFSKKERASLLIIPNKELLFEIKKENRANELIIQ
jgi:hypothetical protein